MTSAPAAPKEGGGLSVAPWPRVDFAAFGEVETVSMTRLQRLTADYLHRNWVSIPHVFHQDEADLSALQTIQSQQADATRGGRVTTLAFVARAVADALILHPNFNVSLDLATGSLVRKRYVHLGVAVDTPNGLLVAVVRDCDKLDVTDIGNEISRLASKAREKGLSMAEMSGGCFTISSLGKAGGTSFTPIINAPEVGILGLSRPIERPVRSAGGEGIEWRPMLPLSLSYDHRVNNGMDAARFMATLRGLIESPQTNKA